MKLSKFKAHITTFTVGHPVLMSVAIGGGISMAISIGLTMLYGQTADAAFHMHGVRARPV